MVKAVNGAEFRELLASGKTFVCDFWASWCAPCRMLAPVMDEVSGEFSRKAEFVKLDIDGDPEIAAEYGVTSIPYVAVFGGGAIKADSLGYVPAEVLRDFFNENL